VAAQQRLRLAVVWLTDAVLLASSDGPPGLFPARQQMAVSLGWHTLACFGVAFPTMIYVVHRRGIVRPGCALSGAAMGESLGGAVRHRCGVGDGAQLRDGFAVAGVDGPVR
jgi:cytochrome bd ubiquinol oxidase subunit I